MPFHATREPQEAATALARGHLAVIPTETVYGLGAVADDAQAVARIFAIKQRPVDHPLIVHVQNSEAVDAWTRSIPAYARALMRELWPGPLTLVLPRSERAADYLTGAQDTVALRVPGSPVAREVLRGLCRELDDPAAGVAAPSANRFGRVSPTTADHAATELGDFLQAEDVILDAGPSVVGVESTIVDCTGKQPVILRPGKVTAEQVERVCGVSLGEASTVRAPGTLASHYSPNAHLVLVDDVATVQSDGVTSVGLLAAASIATPAGFVRLCAPGTDEEYAACLYRALREADSLELTKIVAVPPAGPGLAEAIRDRLQRAAHA